MLAGTHDLKLLVVTIDGIALPRGAADGDYVTIEPTSDIYTHAVGADGLYHRATTSDEGGLVTIRAKNTSLALRAILDGILRRNRRGVTATSTISLQSLSTGESITCLDCWPETPPSITFGAEVSDREYTFRSARIVTA